jgi:threonyl-tRNA synthetase
MLIIGEKEAEEGKVSVRKQGDGDKGAMTIAEFVAYFKNLLATE